MATFRKPSVRPPAQFVLSAATIPGVGTKSTQQQFRAMFPNAKYIVSELAHRTVPGLDRVFLPTMDDSDKDVALLDTVRECEDGAVLVFANTSARADAVSVFLSERGYQCAALHAGVEASERADRLGQLRRGRVQVLVCTDIAARGLDIRNVGTVVEYDFALNVADHMHRAGRTARAGEKGRLVSFVTAQDHALASAIADRRGQKVDALFSRNRVFRRRIKRANAAA